jgi:hypothetical protein
MSPSELGWRVSAAARIQRDRLLSRVSAPRWDRSRLKDVLDPHFVDPVLHTHIERRDWMAAQRALVRSLGARPRLFVLDPRSSAELRNEILRRWPQAAAAASARADRIMGGHYDLLGYRGLSFEDRNGRIDWHLDPVHQRVAPRKFWSDVPFLESRVGDHKIIWEINRHQHWLALGRALWLTRDRRYAWAIVSQLGGWMDANPPLTGINWASALELGFRSLSWVWALHFLLADTAEGSAGRSQAPWLIDMLVGLDRQLKHVEQNLSYYFSPNTHLTGEALALYVAGLSLPELASSRRWVATGRRILLGEIERQIGADGGHSEASPHYHRYTLDFYLLALLMAERSRDMVAVTRFTDAATRLAEFMRAVADDRGRRPLIGDDDGGTLWPIAGRPCADVRDSLALAAVVLGRPDLAPWGVPEEVFWIAGRTAIDQEPFVARHRSDAEPPASRSFPDTGYVVSRDGAGGHLVFDVGRHGFLNGGHAHTDALALTLNVHGTPLLVDPGTSTYTMDPPLRDRMRSSASHNTITLDGRSPAEPGGPFHWRSHADARLHTARHNPAFDWAEGWHDAYEQHTHRRSVFRAPGGGWLVVDDVSGHGRVTADVNWHFDPAWTVIAEAATRIRATHVEGHGAWLVHDGAGSSLFHGDADAGPGWFAPIYGTLVPTWSARVTRAAAPPFSMVTWISTAADAPSLSRVSNECDPSGNPVVAVRVFENNVAWTTMIRHRESPVRDTRGCTVGAFHTDARLLHYGSREKRLVSLAVCDASHVLSLHEGWLSIAADGAIQDLYLEVVDDRIELWSSLPAPRLRIQGALVAEAAGVRLNGRDLRSNSYERADTVVAMPTCWGEPGRITPCVGLRVSRT